MRKRAFDPFAALAHQAAAASSPHPATIAIHRRPGLPRPITSPPVRFGHVGPDTHGVQVDQGLIAVIPLITGSLPETDLSGSWGFVQSLFEVFFFRFRSSLSSASRLVKVLASLNHPGIAAIYGLEESDDTRALVLELVEGPTLADGIAQSPIPWPTSAVRH